MTGVPEAQGRLRLQELAKRLRKRWDDAPSADDMVRLEELDDIADEIDAALALPSAAPQDWSHTHGPFCARDCPCGQGNGPVNLELAQAHPHEEPAAAPRRPEGEPAQECEHDTLEMWRTAALTKDRTRAAIRERVKAGENQMDIADDFRVPLAFVSHLAQWQMFGYEPPEAKVGAVERSSSPPQKCVVGEYCRKHGFIHGAEAEELRERVTQILDQVDHEGDDAAEALDRALRVMLDEVDARDSCAVQKTRAALGDRSPSPPAKNLETRLPRVQPMTDERLYERHQYRTWGKQGFLILVFLFSLSVSSRLVEAEFLTLGVVLKDEGHPVSAAEAVIVGDSAFDSHFGRAVKSTLESVGASHLQECLCSKEVDWDFRAYEDANILRLNDSPLESSIPNDDRPFGMNLTRSSSAAILDSHVNHIVIDDFAVRSKSSDEHLSRLRNSECSLSQLGASGRSVSSRRSLRQLPLHDAALPSERIGLNDGGNEQAEREPRDPLIRRGFILLAVGLLNYELGLLGRRWRDSGRRQIGAALIGLGVGLHIAGAALYGLYYFRWTWGWWL